MRIHTHTHMHTHTLAHIPFYHHITFVTYSNQPMKLQVLWIPLSQNSRYAVPFGRERRNFNICAFLTDWTCTFFLQIRHTVRKCHMWTFLSSIRLTRTEKKKERRNNMLTFWAARETCWKCQCLFFYEIVLILSCKCLLLCWKCLQVISFWDNSSLTWFSGLRLWLIFSEKNVLIKL